MDQAIGSAALPHRGFFSGSRKMYVAIALLVLAIGYFGFTAFKSATVYYMTVDELFATGTKANETVRVAGKLVPGSFQSPTRGSTIARFSISGTDSVLPAVYSGIIPDLFFNEQSQIVLEGRYDGSGLFQASSLVVKCPSKYQAAESKEGATA